MKLLDEIDWVAAYLNDSLGKSHGESVINYHWSDNNEIASSLTVDQWIEKLIRQGIRAVKDTYSSILLIISRSMESMINIPDLVRDLLHTWLLYIHK